jgi:hypothetical protein
MCAEEDIMDRAMTPLYIKLLENGVAIVEKIPSAKGIQKK